MISLVIPLIFIFFGLWVAINVVVAIWGAIEEFVKSRH